MFMTSILHFWSITSWSFLGPHHALVHSFAILEERPLASPRQRGPIPNTETALPMSRRSSSNNYTRPPPRRNIRLPLLVDNMISSTTADNPRLVPRWNVPLPNAHLPPELTTASFYELELDAPVHTSVMRHAMSSVDGCCYGHVVKRECDEDLIGAIGCAGEILIGAPRPCTTDSDAGERFAGQERGEGRGERALNDLDGDEEDAGPLLVLARGLYRFRVKEVLSSIPYPTAVVDELLDEDVESGTTTDLLHQTSFPNEYDDDEDDDDDIYNELTSKELTTQILDSLGRVLKSQYEASTVPLSPLEQSILESAASPEPMAQAIQRTLDAEERLAVYQTFVASLFDIAPEESDRGYAVAMLAGELANFPSDVRVRMLTTVDGAARLRTVLRELSSMVALESARRMTKSISLGVKQEEDEEIDPINDHDDIGSITPPTADALRSAEDSLKELKVGIPPLPPWANQIKEGVRVEYFWNEMEGWCAGTVVGDPIKIVDEIIVTVQFDDDGSVHRLPLRGEDKARWRPPEIGSWS